MPRHSCAHRGIAVCSQVWVKMRKGAAASVLPRIAQKFPRARTLKITSMGSNARDTAAKELADALAALPDSCWPAVTRIERGYGGTDVTEPAAAAHLPRLCPRLQRVCVGTHNSGEPAMGAALCGALESLRAVRPSLEELDLDLSCACLRAGSIPRAAAALGALQGLRELKVTWWGNGPEEACPLPEALPALSALTSLTLSLTSPSSLGGCPASLRDLTLRGWAASCVLGTLRSAPQLAGVTRLCVDNHK